MENKNEYKECTFFTASRIPRLIVGKCCGGSRTQHIAIIAGWRSCGTSREIYGEKAVINKSGELL
jgi:hypothetical protein